MLKRGSAMALLMGVMIVGYSFVTAHGADEGGAKRIAVVNVSRVFDAYAKKKEITTKMEQRFGADRAALEQKDKELQDIELRLKADIRPPENKDKFIEMQKLQFEKFTQELAVRKLMTDIEDQKKNEMKAVLNDIKRVIRFVGTAEHYDLVLRAPEFDDDFDTPKMNADRDRDAATKESEAKTATELVRRFRENPVLYFSQGVDITDKVIAKLNDEYRQSQK